MSRFWFLFFLSIPVAVIIFLLRLTNIDNYSLDTICLLLGWISGVIYNKKFYETKDDQDDNNANF